MEPAGVGSVQHSRGGKLLGEEMKESAGQSHSAYHQNSASHGTG